MTAAEVRDRLDERFRLLVGSRVDWSATRHCITRWRGLTTSSMTLKRHCWRGVRCSPGVRPRERLRDGFDDIDDFAILDLLDALVRKSLLVADRSWGGPELDAGDDPPIRRGATRGPRRSPEIRTAHRGISRGVRPASWPSGTARDSARPTVVQGRTGQSAHGVSVGRRSWRRRRGGPYCDIRDILGNQAGNYEPIGWAEELIEPARAVDHPRLGALYEMASIATSSDGSTRLSGTATRVRRFSAAAEITSCRSAARAYLAVHTYSSGSPNGRSSGAAPAGTRSRHPYPDPDPAGHRTDGRRCC